MTGQTIISTEQNTIATLLGVFRTHSHFILTSHVNPDGDAIGSVLGLAELLEQFGASTEIVLADPVPHVFRSLPGADRIRHARSASPGWEHAPAILLECDVVRCGLEGLQGRLIVNIDHHASAVPFGDLNWIDESASACAAMIYRLAQAAEVEDASVRITPTMATTLYAAILTDTGAFTYAATDARTFAIAQELTDRGASPSGIARDIYFSNSLSKIRLLGTALHKLNTEGPLAWTAITQSDLDRAGASVEECEGIVNQLIGIEGVESAFFLREAVVERTTKVSLRSKGSIDVSQVAEKFGGGGHRVASGCTLALPVTETAQRILAELRMRLC